MPVLVYLLPDNVSRDSSTCSTDGFSKLLDVEPISAKYSSTVIN